MTALAAALAVWAWFDSAQASSPLVLVMPPVQPRADGVWEVHAALVVQLSQLPNVAIVVPDTDSASSDEDRPEMFAAARSLATEQQATSVVWLGREGDAVYFFVWDAETQHGFRRRLALGESGQAQAVEQAAAIVRWAIQALVDRQSLALEPVAMPEETPAPESPLTRNEATPRLQIAAAPAEPTRERDDLILWLGYAGERLAPTVAWHQGVRLGVGVPLGRFSASAFYTLTKTLSVQGETVSAAIDRHPFELRLSIHERRQRWSLWGGAALSLDVSTRTTTAMDDVPGLTAASARTLVSVGVGPHVGFSLRLQRYLSLYLGVGLAFMVRNVRYYDEAQAGAGVLTPHWLKTQGEVGLMVPL